jgi:hypothetical protein
MYAINILKNIDKISELVMETIKVPTKTPKTTPGAIGLKASQMMLFLALCALILENDVTTIDVIAVPKAKGTALLAPIPLLINITESTGTIIPPPPIPKSPAINPTTNPKASRQIINSNVISTSVS